MRASECIYNSKDTRPMEILKITRLLEARDDADKQEMTTDLIQSKTRRYPRSPGSSTQAFLV